MTRFVILRAVVKLIMPFIMLFALYVQFHGDYGPGGGFQAGVIFASALILYALMGGREALTRVISPTVLQRLFALGVLIYAGVGVVTMINGGNFLDYDYLDSHDPKHGQHLGLLLIELGVGITVSTGMVIIYLSMAGRREARLDD